MEPCWQANVTVWRDLVKCVVTWGCAFFMLMHWWSWEIQKLTQEPAYWMLPSAIQKVEYAAVKDINFKSAKAMRKDLNDNIEAAPTPRRQVSSQKLPNVPTMSESEIAEFYRKLHISKGNPVILPLTPNYAPCYVPSCLRDSFPMILTELYDETLASKPVEELLDHWEHF